MHSMEYNAPRSYGNFMPSKKIRITIGIIALAIALYFFIPWAVRKGHQVAVSGQASDSLVAIPTTDPTIRDSSGTGIPDWELIAVGIDPHDPNAAAEFAKIRTQISPQDLTNLENQTTDTDKVSLAIYGDLAATSQVDDGISGTSVGTATGDEVLNYIAAQKAKLTLSTLSDLNIVPSSLATNQAYYKQEKQIVSLNNPVFKTFLGQLQTYFAGTGDKTSLQPGLDLIEKNINDLKSVPVPDTAAPMNLGVINELQELYQTVSTYDPANSDDLSRMSSLSIVQDSLINLTKSEGGLTIYFSIALDPKGYAQ